MSVRYVVHAKTVLLDLHPACAPQPLLDVSNPGQETKSIGFEACNAMQCNAMYRRSHNNETCGRLRPRIRRAD